MMRAEKAIFTPKTNERRAASSYRPAVPHIRSRCGVVRVERRLFPPCRWIFIFRSRKKKIQHLVNYFVLVNESRLRNGSRWMHSFCTALHGILVFPADAYGASHSRGNVIPLVPTLFLDQRQQEGIKKRLLYRVRPRPAIPEPKPQRGSQQVLQGPLLQNQRQQPHVDLVGGIQKGKEPRRREWECSVYVARP